MVNWQGSPEKTKGLVELNERFHLYNNVYTTVIE